MKAALVVVALLLLAASLWAGMQWITAERTGRRRTVLGALGTALLVAALAVGTVAFAAPF
ncbi:hypothetical protein [Actinocatenispora rupis]|uniref:Uncharacterized protein n=1 Tax=Actinocatenispora rupis TaxID=519421 RepID=A0A8J3J541_9ACTN|nr:hypothetical protein [Actinocatenispora rupis]GID14910.1 hypothetical protein Aru02nite_57990 [Actinocatenispora rupis]